MSTLPDEVIDQLRDVFVPVTQLVQSLDRIEPGGTLNDELVVQSKKYGEVTVTFCKNPLIVNIGQGGKTYVLKVVE